MLGDLNTVYAMAAVAILAVVGLGLLVKDKFPWGSDDMAPKGFDKDLQSSVSKLCNKYNVELDVKYKWKNAGA